MAEVTVFYQADDDAEVQQWAIDWSSLTIGEVLDLEKHSGKEFREFKAAFLSGSVTALVLVMWVIRKRDEPTLTLNDLRKLDYDRFAAKVDVDAEGDAEGEPSGKAPSDAQES